MSVIPLVETTAALTELTAKIVGGLLSSEDPHRHHDEIVVALRTIYFTPHRTLEFLERLANGETLSEDEVLETLPEFNDAEWRVEHALRLLEDNFERREVSLRASTVLREIAWGKRRIRRHVQELLNEDVTFGRPINREDVQLVIASIKSLNASIETLEAAYNWRAGRF